MKYRVIIVLLLLAACRQQSDLNRMLLLHSPGVRSHLVRTPFDLGQISGSYRLETTILRSPANLSKEDHELLKGSSLGISHDGLDFSRHFPGSTRCAPSISTIAPLDAGTFFKHDYDSLIAPRDVGISPPDTLRIVDSNCYANELSTLVLLPDKRVLLRIRGNFFIFTRQPI